MARTRRRRIKEDKFVSTTAKIYMFLNKHWKRIAIIAAGILIVIVVLSAYHSYRTGKQGNIAIQLSEAKALFTEAADHLGKGEDDLANAKYVEASAKFQEIVQKGGRGINIAEARFFLARTAYELVKYDEAISSFQQVVSKYPKSIFANYARAGLGQSYEQLGGDENLRKAIDCYDELSRQPVESYVTLRAFIDKGRCHEKLGEWDQAVAAYQIIVDKFKQKVEAAVQAKSKECVEKAEDVISKYKSASGQDPLSAEIAELAKGKSDQGQWFDALKVYDKAIFSQKVNWSNQEAAGSSQTFQEAKNALKEYEELSGPVISYISSGRDAEERGDWDSASLYYRSAVEKFDFLPGADLFGEAQFRIDLINSTAKRQE